MIVLEDVQLYFYLFVLFGYGFLPSRVINGHEILYGGQS